jgi:hypothetical protein
MKISMDKQYRTRDGRKVRIYAVDGQKPFSVHGAILTNGQWSPNDWYEDGTNYRDSESNADLFECGKGEGL